MILHTRLDTALFGLNTATAALDIRLAGFNYRDAAQQSFFAGFGKRSEMLPDTRPDPPFTGLNAGAMLLDFGPATVANGCRL
ncbi:MAG: hypothetical protein J2P48_13795 [Alphaproteobacteria bacterium]|nr:hypothetical protein [Alphaproteobacteria bacterium]